MNAIFISAAPEVIWNGATGRHRDPTSKPFWSADSADRIRPALLIRSVQERKTIKKEHYLVTAPIKEEKKKWSGEDVNGGLKQSCVQPQNEGGESCCLPAVSMFLLRYANLYSILWDAGPVSQLQRGLTVQINTVSTDHTSPIITEAAPNWEIDLLFFV